MLSRLPKASVTRPSVLTGRSRRNDQRRRSSAVTVVSRRPLFSKTCPPTVVVRSIAAEGEDATEPPVAVSEKPALGHDILLTPVEREIRAFISKNDLWKAEQLFETLEDKTLMLYNRFLKGLQSKGLYEKCWFYYKQMLERGVQPDIYSYSIMLNVCAKQKDTEQAMMLWKELESNEECALDRVLYNSMIQVFIAADHREEKAMELLKEMKSKGINPDSVTYNTMLSGFARSDRIGADNAQRVDIILKDMQEEGLEFDAYTYRALSRFSWKSGNRKRSGQYIDEMIKTGIPVKTSIYVSLIDDYSNLRVLGDANWLIAQCWKIYQEIEKNTPYVPMEAFMAMLSLYVSTGHWKGIFGLLDIMREKDMHATINVYSILLKGLASMKASEREGAIVAGIFVKEMRDARISMTPTVLTFLIRIYLNAREMDTARMYFNELKRSRSPLLSVGYKALLEYFSDVRIVSDWQTSLKEILSLMDEMRAASIPFSLANYVAAIRTCVRCNDWTVLDQILEDMKQSGKHPPIRSYSMILNMCAKAEDREKVQRAWTYFAETKKLGLRLNVIVYTTMINVCDVLDDLEGGLRLVEEMKENNIQLNEHTYTSLMHLTGKTGNLDQMEALFQEYEDSNLEVNTTAYGVLIHAYGKANRIDKVLQIYAQLQQKGVQLDLLIFRNLIQAAGDCHRVDLIYEFYDAFSSKQRLDHSAYFILSTALEKNGDFEGAAAILELEKDEHEKGPATVVT